LNKALFAPGDILVYDPVTDKAEEFAARGAVTRHSAESLVSDAGAVVLAAKPQDFAGLLPMIKDAAVGKLFISVAAGISIDYIRAGLGDAAVVRVMPNLPMLYSAGVTALCKGPGVTDDQFALAEKIFAACGKTGVIEESQMNAMTAVHASSPAFLFLFAKAAGDYAAGQGVDKGLAIELFSHAMAGSAKMLIESGRSCDDLIAMVASPGGTTQAALDRFAELGFTEIISQAMEACTARAAELGR